MVYSDGLYYKMYVEGSLNKDGKPMFKMYGLCEDSKVTLHEEELAFFEMKSILNLIIVRDVLPPYLPIKNIRTFQDICKYFLFPFMLTTSENKNSVVVGEDPGSTPADGTGINQSSRNS